MKKSLKSFFLLFTVVMLVSPAFSQKTDSLKLKTHIDSISYIIGFDNGNYFKNQGIDIDINSFIKGLQQSASGKKCAISEADKAKIMNAFQQEMQKKMQEKQKSAGAENKIKGKAFLDANKKNKGVIVTASGLQYEVLKEGTGKSPKAKDEVTVNYVGKTLDGKIFDSSFDRGQPATFMLSGVIAGWTEGLQLMKEGGKYRFYIPAELAYGDRGAGNDIPAGATLIFEVDLISVQVK